jgi:enamine deaminase RidA (YjgF/YER057c/UK114 family)
MKNTESTLTKTQVNPWTWQDRLGFSQAWRVDGARSLVFVSGQVGYTSEGQPVDSGSDAFEAQARQALENLKTVLGRSGASIDDVVKLNVYLTDMSRLRDWGRIKAEYIKGEQPASTALGVTALAQPALMIEVEATAVV